MKYLFFTSFILFSFSLFAQIPSSFDLRDYNGENYVTSVKSQEGGTCWTHGTMASTESNLMMTGAWTANGETGEPNLAEYHLDWYNGFNDSINDDYGTNPPGLEVHMGGDYRVSTAYLSRAEGAVRDIDGQSFDDPPERYNSSYHYYYPRRVEWYNAEEDLSKIDTIKTKLMQYGAMATCICYDYGFIDYNYNHYQPSSNSMLPNHSVTIIGWDDSHSVPAAPQNGAWLVKNSWGTGWGYSGYFWISYYDKWSCKEPDMGAVSFIDVEPLQYDTVYYHDYHGWRDTKTDSDSAFNAFSVNEDVLIEAVSFFVDADDVNYEVKIFKTFSSGELRNLQTTQTGNIVHRGFHTIDLDDNVELIEGDDFYVFLYLDKGGQPYDRTSDVPVLLGGVSKTIVPSTANPAESYYCEAGEWLDFYDYDDPSGFDNTGNFCIKALAVSYEPVNINDVNDIKFEIYPNPAKDFIRINTGSQDIISYKIFDISGKQLSSGNLPESQTIDISRFSKGLYFIELEVNNKSFTEKLIIK
ncbi:MAG: T9SS type A sorting domain-containing protein [Bacteroidales bacterium]|nr:T9SS type A sorting domain-containing protein [Bacteroidales bacterium]